MKHSMKQYRRWTSGQSWRHFEVRCSKWCPFCKDVTQLQWSNETYLCCHSIGAIGSFCQFGCQCQVPLGMPGSSAISGWEAIEWKHQRVLIFVILAPLLTRFFQGFILAFIFLRLLVELLVDFVADLAEAECVCIEGDSSICSWTSSGFEMEGEQHWHVPWSGRRAWSREILLALISLAWYPFSSPSLGGGMMLPSLSFRTSPSKMSEDIFTVGAFFWKSFLMLKLFVANPGIAPALSCWRGAAVDLLINFLNAGMVEVDDLRDRKVVELWILVLVWLGVRHIMIAADFSPVFIDIKLVCSNQSRASHWLVLNGH